MTRSSRVLALGLATSAALAAAAGAPGCGSSAPAATPTDGGARDATGAADGAQPDAPSALTYGMSAHLAPGTDAYRCKYVALPSGADTTMIGAAHAATQGVHHLLVFRTDLAAIPAGADGERDCYAPSDDVMPHARAQIYGSQQRSGTFTLPSSVGLPLRAGEVLLMQAHDQDATAGDLDARLTFSIATSAAPVATRAGTFFFAAPFIDVPAGQTGSASLRCALPQGATILSAAGYAHARATDFAAYLDTPGAPPSAAPFYRAPGSANPLPLQATLAAPAGARVRFACAYDNTRGTSEIFQGTRDDADEQCVLSGVYAPDLGADVDACRAQPDEMGAGSATCAATRACVAACPAGSAPPADLGLGDDGAIDPCWQRCVAASCADASGLLFALRACQRAKCADACAVDAGTSAGDAGEPCAACTSAQCASEEGACAADACR